MKTIWKYELTVNDMQEVMMPSDAKVVSFGTDPNGVVCIWALVETDNSILPLHARLFRLAGTGHPLPPNIHDYRFIGTTNMGMYVWHLFEFRPVQSRGILPQLGIVPDEEENKSYPQVNQAGPIITKLKKPEDSPDAA